MMALHRNLRRKCYIRMKITKKEKVQTIVKKTFKSKFFTQSILKIRNIADTRNIIYIKKEFLCDF